MTAQRLEQHKQALDAYLKKWFRTADFTAAIHAPAIAAPRVFESKLDLCCEVPSVYPDFVRFTGNLEEGFPARVRRLAAEKKVKQIELIGLTGIGRSTFYRILSGETMPSKEHCVEIALSLRLNYTQAQELLESAGYALSRSDKRDMALRYFFVNRIYNIAIINELLEGQQLALICDPE